MASDPMLTVPQVAERCGVAVKSVYRWIERGRINVTRLGDGPKPRVRIPESELARFMGTRVEPAKWSDHETLSDELWRSLDAMTRECAMRDAYIDRLEDRLTELDPGDPPKPEGFARPRSAPRFETKADAR